MENVFLYQIEVDLQLLRQETNNQLAFRSWKGESAEDLPPLLQALEQELREQPSLDSDSVRRIEFAARNLLLYRFFNRETDELQGLAQRVLQVISYLDDKQAPNISLSGWKQFSQFLLHASERISRENALEEFESKLDKFEWSHYQGHFLALVSMLVGYVYLHEKKEQAQKSRLWLEKSMAESPEMGDLAARYLLCLHLSGTGERHQIDRADQLASALPKDYKKAPESLVRSAQAVRLELEMVIELVRLKDIDDQGQKIEKAHQKARSFGVKIDEAGFILPVLMPAFQLELGRYWALIGAESFDPEDQEKAGQETQKIGESAIGAAEMHFPESKAWRYTLLHYQNLMATGVTPPEKPLKKVVSKAKKAKDLPTYVTALDLYCQSLRKGEKALRIEGLLAESFKMSKKLRGYASDFMFLSTFQVATGIFLAETHESGVSWMVHILQDFFDPVIDYIEGKLESEEVLLPSVRDELLESYQRFEPVSHFNIYVYYRYQFYSIKLLELSSRNTNPMAESLAKQLIGELSDPNNPLSFMDANWEDFKLVPNSVRNKTLNKCINISKGDLPLAAEHLDFSYRNLRSYITFEEINRLGFFLDMQQTSNRQLEQGLRLMFHDLYRQGTIFEVVFDMPRFLVQHAIEGFYAQDLEEAMDVKGTTAKKYLKIMIGIGMVRQDKSQGRKHFYRLKRENIMKRLGKEVSTLIS